MKNKNENPDPLANVYTIEYNEILRFDWDDDKNKINFKKHAIWFEEAQTIWADPTAIEFFDPEHSSAEDRFVRVGYSTMDHLLLVVFCEREAGHQEIVRIISARMATNTERKQYEAGI
jgi:uncharacterized protein